MNELGAAATLCRRPSNMLVAVVAAVVIAACGVNNQSASHAPTALSVFAASSLRDVMAEAASAYGDVSGIQIEVSTDGSTALRVQIQQGAKPDVFLSADTKNPDLLLAGGLVDGTVVPFARNGLAIIVPRDNPAGIRTAADLGRAGVKVIAAGENVPISDYAAQLLEQLATAPGSGSGFAAAYAANVVSREDNVAAVVAKIELGEGDVAIVYASDAAASKDVLVIPLPRGIAVLATYAGLVPRTADHPSDGHAFLDWVTGSAGQQLLARFGFMPRS